MQKVNATKIHITEIISMGFIDNNYGTTHMLGI